MQDLFLQSRSTCFGRKRPSSGVFKTSTAATGTCVIVAGKSSHLLIRAFQMKHQLDATLCMFYFCRVSLHVSGASAHHQEYLKLVERPLVHVFQNIVLQIKTTHINHNNILIQVSMLMLISYIFLRNTCTSGRCTSFKYSWWGMLAPETCRVTLQK